MDYYPSGANTFTVQGDFYGGNQGSPTITTVDGQNVLGRWTHTFSEESELSVQAYFDRTRREVPGVGSDKLEGRDPRNQSLLQSTMDLPCHFQLDAVARYVDRLPASPLTGTPITPDYFTFDARLAWRFKQWELAVIGKNLWDDSHPEFGSEIPRSIFGKVSWSF